MIDQFANQFEQYIYLNLKLKTIKKNAINYLASNKR